MKMWPSAPLHGWVFPPITWQGSRVCGARTGDVDAESSGTPLLHLPQVCASVSPWVSSVLVPLNSKLGGQVR